MARRRTEPQQTASNVGTTAERQNQRGGGNARADKTRRPSIGSVVLQPALAFSRRRIYKVRGIAEKLAIDSFRKAATEGMLYLGFASS